MAITKREFILATCVLSGAASIISFVSLGTQYWVTSKGKWADPTLTKLNEIRYGLFSGTLRVFEPFPALYELQMTCLLDKNVCAFLCGSDESGRQKQLQDLYDGKNPEFDRSCPKITSVLYNEPGKSNPSPRAKDGSDLDYINAGVWVTTIMFICLSGLMGIIAAGIAVWNTASNPIQLYLSVFGLYIYNGIAFFCVLLVLLLWGIMFAKTTIHNVAVLYTLEGEISSDERAELGYSYWINMVSLFLYAASIGLLYLRQYLIAKEPKVDVNMEDNGDPGLYLY